VFNRDSGCLLNDPSLEAIFAVRQITLMFGKIALDCTPSRVNAAIEKYVECEQDVLHESSLFISELDRFDRFRAMGVKLWAELFARVDSRVYNDSVIPRHGPGATADQLRGNAKYNNLTWTVRLEEVFPHWEHLIPSESFLQRTDRVNILEPGDEIPVRVITVPKTLKTPRIIAVEPCHMQYMQQGVLAVMMEEIPRSDHARNFVMFESQEPNQRLAREGSTTGALATLDLSEASDRVSNEHVRLLVRNHRMLRRAVDATRSRKAHVPGHGTISLAKFASMGSALCFPFEAIVFTTVIFVGIEKALGRPLTQKDLRSFYGRVRVYGDDIVIPVDFVPAVVAELEAFGFKVNTRKSFWTGKFRESCGAEFYDGCDVSISRVRELLPTNRTQAERLVSTVALRNRFFHKSLFRTVDFLDRLIGKIIPFPIVEWRSIDGNIVQNSAVLGRHTFGSFEPDGWDEGLQLPLVKGAVVLPKPRVSQLDDYGALLKCLLQLERAGGGPDRQAFPANPTSLNQRAGLSGHRSSDLGSYSANSDLERFLLAGSDKPLLVLPALQGRSRPGAERIGLRLKTDTDHLRFAGRPRSVNIKIVMAHPF